MFMFPSSYRHENSTSTPSPPTPTPTPNSNYPFIIALGLFIPFMIYFGKVVINTNRAAEIQSNKCDHLAWRAAVRIDKLEREHPEIGHRISDALEDAEKLCKDNNGAVP